jgi:hypothetical protein
MQNLGGFELAILARNPRETLKKDKLLRNGSPASADPLENTKKHSTFSERRENSGVHSCSKSRKLQRLDVPDIHLND